MINDDRPSLDLMEQLLQEAESYEVTTRKEWEGAYEYVKDHRPDLVILDIRFGGEEQGWQILQMLTLDPETLPHRLGRFLEPLLDLRGQLTGAVLSPGQLIHLRLRLLPAGMLLLVGSVTRGRDAPP